MPSSQAMISSWTWSEQPPRTALASVLAAIVKEQGELVGSAAGTTLSSMRLRQRLTVTQRYLTALGRTAQPAQQQERSVPVVAVVEEREDRRPPGERAAMGLARVGSRAALSFAFAFLRRAWRSGEDQDLCSDLLSESLEALQALPEASLFDSKSVSAVSKIPACKKHLAGFRATINKASNTGGGHARHHRGISCTSGEVRTNWTSIREATSTIV